ncbi:1346_t:CDS:2 [Funneliformis geosporum]|uniref:10345_t:CDS:1 n=1 Tax=Funneliformis geosporum TaxID=1117311 RepID=A0A9W4SQI2_9GLOM|nr:10345_t:CDS:2 [Funneliformis geosporum]CAI2178141.1 1346_t:CDS:2 [Funneliformis geosporum]
MSPITRSKTSTIRWRHPDFPTFQDLEAAYKIAYPKIQEYAKELLEMKLEEEDIRQNFYNPTSPEYWFINNTEALEEVVYYKMKKRLILRYKEQLIAAGVDLSEYSDTESEFGGEVPPTLEEYIEEGGNISEDQVEPIFSSISSRTPPTSLSSFQSSHVTNFRFTSTLMKKDESNTTSVLDGYDGSNIITNRNRNIREVAMVHHSHHHGRAQFVNNILRSINCHFPMHWITNLTTQKLEYILSQRQKNLLKGQLQVAVKAQVKEFIDQEISRASKGLMQNTEEDNDFIGFVRTQLNEVFQEQLEKFMDIGSGADFALITGGARIIHKLTSKNYELRSIKPYQKLLRLGGFSNNVIKSKIPETVISPNINVGECWCFNGTSGQITIKLSRSIIFTHIIYHHISRDVSIDPILSAPKEFELWGLPTSISTTGENENSLEIFKNDYNVFLGKYQYDINGLPKQKFILPDSIAKSQSNKRISAVMMKVLNNHENPQFTCLYRLQIHGVMPH